MITPLLHSALDPVIRRHRQRRAIVLASLVIATIAALAWLLPALGLMQRPPLVVLALLAYFVGWRLSQRVADNWEPNFTNIARDIETRHPDLHALLLTAVEQRPDPTTGKLHYLQQRVLAEAAERAKREQWINSVPNWHLGAAKVGLVAAVLALLVPAAVTKKPTRIKHTAAPQKQVLENGITVSPGDTEVERGTGLVVLVTFSEQLPSEATLVVETPDQPSRRIPLTRNLDDPVFGGALAEVDANLRYRVEYAGQATRDFAVRVFEHPRLERADATLRYPEFTKLPEKKIPDTKRISAVEGTKLDLAFELNKPVKTAKLVAKDGTTIPLTVEAEKPVAHLKDFAMAGSRTYELQLEDADGRKNKVPAQFVIDASANRRPEMKFVSPRGDQRVSPIEELTFRAEIWDDFGIPHYGLTYQIVGGEPKEIELGKDTKADERVNPSLVMKLEELGVQPDELISWFLWADDTGPDGQLRRTETDMFFAEVRPFEEIYRPGDGSEGAQQSQQAGAGGAGEEAMQLAQTQKQIISASWNLKRAEDAVAKSPSDKYAKDHPVILEAQEKALAMANELAAEAADAKSRGLVANATREMQTALDRLKEAAASPKPLPAALAAEQAAYNALLKLAAHEFRVSRNQQNNSSSGQAQQQQQAQLDQLEMKEESKRYETQSEAQSTQTEQQREQLAALNRLKELAQRQQDINERLKEMQNALQAAKTEEEKEEVRRQLQRLREEEQRMLADIDELRQQMEQSPQQSQLAEERQQLEQTRNEAQQASEALERNAATQALASGTRAAQQLEKMRDDFRKKTSGQFNDEMREMRSEARDLAEKQEQIAEKLTAESTKPQRRTLDGSGEAEKLAQQFTQQRTALGELKEDMKRVSEHAEAGEPLLARELYDTLRKNAQVNTERNLEMTQRLAERGYQEQAQAFEQKARAEIEELKTGVERAAESVLGDEAEALRQARAEIEALGAELDREIARNTGQPGRENSPQPGDAQVPAAVGNSAPEGTAQAGTRDGQPGEGERPSETQQPGTQPGEGQRSTTGRRTAENRPGERGNGPPRENAERQLGPGEGQEEQRAQAAGQRGEGQQPGEAESPGETPGQGQRSERTAQSGQRGQGNQPGGEQQPSEQDGEPANRAGQQPGQQPGQGQGRAQAQAQGQASGRGGAGGRSLGAQQAGDRNQPNGEPSLRDLANSPRQPRGGNPNGRGDSRGGGEENPAGPLTGDQFVEWSDRLRNVEEMLDDPDLRTEAARVRELARGMRVEYKRHSVMPNWDLARAQISTPLTELRNRVSEELARRESKQNLVPIDRDPVPTKFADRVRRYYEELGRSR